MTLRLVVFLYLTKTILQVTALFFTVLVIKVFHCRRFHCARVIVTMLCDKSPPPFSPLPTKRGRSQLGLLSAIRDVSWEIRDRRTEAVEGGVASCLKELACLDFGMLLRFLDSPFAWEPFNIFITFDSHMFCILSTPKYPVLRVPRLPRIPGFTQICEFGLRRGLNGWWLRRFDMHLIASRRANSVLSRSRGRACPQQNPRIPGRDLVRPLNPLRPQLKLTHFVAFRSAFWIRFDSVPHSRFGFCSFALALN